MTAEDPAVQALADMAWAVVPDEADLPLAAATVLATVREDLRHAHQLGDVAEVVDVHEWLASRIADLTNTGRPEPEPGPGPEVATAEVTVDEHGRLTSDSRITVDGLVITVPEVASNGTVIAESRIATALRQWGWRTVAGTEYDRSQPGTARIPVQRVSGRDG